MRLLAIIPALAMCGSAYSTEITDPKHYFKLLCVSDATNGLSWKNGKWVDTNFSTKTYIMKKLKIKSRTDVFPLSGFCDQSLDIKKYPLTVIDFRSKKESIQRQGCYNLHEVGTTLSWANSNICIEKWTSKEKPQILLEIQCGYLDTGIYSPNGHYHRSNLSSELDSISENKEIQYIEVGKCSVID